MQLEPLENYFPSPVRNRARDYERALRVLEQGPDFLHVHVRGADDYCLRLERSAESLGVTCTCPYFDGVGPCKHVWAALLHAQRIGALAGDPSPRKIVRIAPSPHDRTTRRRDVTPAAPPPPPPKPRSTWRQALREVDERLRPHASLPTGAELSYVVDLAASATRKAVQLELGMRTRKMNGELSRPRSLSIGPASVPSLPDAVDREVLAIAVGLSGRYAYTVSSRLDLPAGISVAIVSKLAAHGRLSLRNDARDRALSPCRWDDGPEYELGLVVTPDDSEGWRVRGVLRRDDEALDVMAPRLVLQDGLVFFADRVARLSIASYRWAALLRAREGTLLVPADEAHEFVLDLLMRKTSPPVELPEALRLVEHRAKPKPRLALHDANRASSELRGTLSFDYDGVIVAEDHPVPRVTLDDARTVLVRDAVLEEAARARLVTAGVRRDPTMGVVSWLVPQRRLADAVSALLADGWHVEMKAQRVQTPGTIDVAVTSSIDWFDLSAEVHYGAQRVSLPTLLAAVRRGERFVTLADGSLGLLPEAWLERHRLVGELGTTEGDALRFQKGQLGILDALLAALPEAQVDKQLARARESLARFTSIVPANAPKTFVGSLRAYQQEGLGWLEFLREFGFGGCLADDMGLGKTIQVLALLDARRKKGRTSLVVVPKSLLFNWQREAAQFTPKLRVLEHHGTKRSLANAASYDLVVTTYGTLVRDAAAFQSLELDYAILDEAQAIKNPRTDSAKAARLLRAQHRLVLTGTPIENRLSDLWSLFEFLNPGMLGTSTVWKRFADQPTHEGESALLGRALRPFLLRRTKDQVASDLPAKTEQIIYCELEGEERTQYDELRAHYRASLLGLVEEKGIARSQIHILEALLRLRQAACHPALLDPKRGEQPSAKLTALLGQIEDVVAGGHKAVVFSQFTSLLAVVRRHLDKADIAYEYLDGKTRDRKARVDRFQTDAACPIFLVSLKAGGVGLNLTAAEYVFLLDPWWNPAVEAQAIDRTHRIGQTRPVIAYRLIGRDTIEEKVLALQAQKRALASAIIDTDHALIGSIGKEELELLLS